MRRGKKACVGVRRDESELKKDRVEAKSRTRGGVSELEKEWAEVKIRTREGEKG